MPQSLLDLLKIFVQLLGLNKDKRVSNLQKSFDNFILFRKDLGANPKLDEKIHLLANSITFGDGQLIPTQYSNLAEASANSVQIYELFNPVRNYLTYQFTNPFPVIKDHLGTKEERKKFLTRFQILSFFFFVFIGLITLVTFPDWKNFTSWRDASLVDFFDIAFTVIFLITELMLVVVSSVLVPDRIDKLNTFSELLDSIKQSTQDKAQKSAE